MDTSITIYTPNRRHTLCLFKIWIVNIIKATEKLVNLISEIIGYQGTIEWDTTKPDGTKRKLLDVSKLNNSGWKYSTELKAGIMNAYKNYLAEKI